MRAALPFAQRFEAQAAGGNLQAADADIDAQDLLELPFRHQPFQQLAAAAAKIGHAARSRCGQDLRHRLQPLLIEADGFLKPFLRRVLR